MNNFTNIKDSLLSLVGDYVPSTYLDLEGRTCVYDGIASLDFVWLCSALLLIVAFYVIFRIVGSVLSSIMR